MARGEKPLTCINDNNTRWGSTRAMLARFKVLYDDIKMLAAEKDIDALNSILPK